MKLLSSRKRKITALVVVIVVVVAGVVTAVVLKNSTNSGPGSQRPIETVAGPLGIIGGTSPNASGGVWVLVNVNNAANLQFLEPGHKKPIAVYPMPSSSTSVATNFGPTLGVGLGTTDTGAVKLYSTNTMRNVATVPTPGPVTGLAEAPNGETYYALIQDGDAFSVDVISASAHVVTGKIPMPTGTLSIAISPDLSSIYALQGGGAVSVINIFTKQLTQRFPSGAAARAIALSPLGDVLYVLKGSDASDNISVVDVATERTVSVMPAPAWTQQIAVNQNGQVLYDFVGSNTYGNVQLFSTPK
jgi:hypothetical protein